VSPATGYGIIARVSVPPRIELTVTRGISHVQQPLAGFLLLAKAGEIDLKVQLRTKEASQFPYLIRATIDGVPVVYDLQDGAWPLDSAVDVGIFDGADQLFIRAYSPGNYGEWEERVHPLGLNYVVTVPHPTSVLAHYASGRDAMRSLVVRLLGRRPSSNFRTFECPPSPHRPRENFAVFLSRVWDPDMVKPELGESIHALNRDRVDTVLTLRANLGRRFVGGIAPTAYARANYPDALGPASLVLQKTYLATMRKATVCVTTLGLEESNGWKFGEYMAASKAVVTERPRQQAAGPLVEGENYLAFGNISESVGQVEKLLGDPGLASRMEKANWQYYRKYVRPDSFVRRTVAIAMRAR
jgi:hypothetical protein